VCVRTQAPARHLPWLASPFHVPPPCLACRTRTPAGADLIFEGHTPAMLALVMATALRANPGAQVLMAHHHRNDGLDRQMTEDFAAQVCARQAWGCALRARLRALACPVLRRHHVTIRVAMCARRAWRFAWHGA
jgi:hypothetical protein